MPHDDDHQARNDAQILAFAQWSPERWARLLARLAAEDRERHDDLARRAARAATGPQYERR